jgi:hypothetical protein
MSEWLSEAGQQKRQGILALAHRAARSRRRRRRRQRVARAAAGGATLLLVLALATRWSALHRMPVPGRNPQAVAMNAPATQHNSRVVIERVYADASITEWLAAAPQPPRWEVIDDDALIRSLADAGQPAGLIRIGKETTLVTSPPAE